MRTDDDTSRLTKIFSECRTAIRTLAVLQKGDDCKRQQLNQLLADITTFELDLDHGYADYDGFNVDVTPPSPTLKPGDILTGMVPPPVEPTPVPVINIAEPPPYVHFAPRAWFCHGPYEEGEELRCIFEEPPPELEDLYSPLYSDQHVEQLKERIKYYAHLANQPHER